MNFTDDVHAINNLCDRLRGRTATTILANIAAKLSIEWSGKTPKEIYSSAIREIKADGTSGDLNAARSQLMVIMNDARDQLRGRDKKDAKWITPLKVAQNRDGASQTRGFNRASDRQSWSTHAQAGNSWEAHNSGSRADNFNEHAKESDSSTLSAYTHKFSMVFSDPEKKRIGDDLVTLINKGADAGVVARGLVRSNIYNHPKLMKKLNIQPRQNRGIDFLI